MAEASSSTLKRCSSRGVDTRAAPCEAPTGMGRAGRTGERRSRPRARAPRPARSAEGRRARRARRAEAARAPRRARARARTRRLRRPARREPLARRHARHRRARSPGLRLPASEGARRRDHRDACAGLCRSSSSPSAWTSHRFVRLAGEGRAALAAGDAGSSASALREALALWRGPALADFLYEPFAQTEIARLEELRTRRARGAHRGGSRARPPRRARLRARGARRRRSRCASARARSSCSRSTAPGGRRTRSPPTAPRATRWSKSSASTPARSSRQLEAAILRQDESLLLEETPLAKPAMQFRRLVTILFVDVVESMALAEALDAGGARPRPARYFETVSAALTRHGGTVEKFAGDAVMAAFGIPISHEDDALRAARAALDIRAGIAALNERLVERPRHRARGADRHRDGRGRRDAHRRATTARHRRGRRHRRPARAGSRSGRDRRRRARGPADRPRRDGSSHSARSTIKGRREPVRAFRLLEITPVGPAFERRLDAPLVGRKRELAALRRALKRAVDAEHGARRRRRRPARRRQVAARRGARPPREGRRRRSGAAASRTARASRTGRCARC